MYRYFQFRSAASHFVSPAWAVLALGCHWSYIRLACFDQETEHLSSPSYKSLMRRAPIICLLLALVRRATSFFSQSPTALKLPQVARQTRRTSALQEKFNMAMESDRIHSAKRAMVIGGGPAGALMAMYLSKTGDFKVDLFEAFAESKISGPTVRSWNIVLFERGASALFGAGVDLQKQATEQALKVSGVWRHHASNQAKKKDFFTGSTSICRGDMAKFLLNKASESPNVTVHYDSAFQALDMKKRVATFGRQNGESFDCEYDMLVGADGVNSRVRAILEKDVEDFTVRQRKDPMKFKTILVPIMEMDGAEEVWKTRFHVANSKIGCILAPPRSDGVLTATVVLPGEGANSFETLMKTPEDVRDFFAKWYPAFFGPGGPSQEVAQDFLQRRSQHLTSTYCSSLVHGNVLLVGDAAHSMWASLGQGVNCALEDCMVFAEVLDAAASKRKVNVDDIPDLLRAYNDRRHDDAIAVCKLSEEGMGGARSVRPAFAAQLLVTVLLNQTLGRLAPKVFAPPSLMQMGKNKMSYADMWKGVQREAKVTRGLFIVGVASVLAVLLRKAALKF